MSKIIFPGNFVLPEKCKFEIVKLRGKDPVTLCGSSLPVPAFLATKSPRGRGAENRTEPNCG